MPVSTVDKRLPDHMFKLTYTFADQNYDSAKTITVANRPYFVGVTTTGNVAQYMSFSINATAGTADLQITSNKQWHFRPEMLRGRPGQHDADLGCRASTRFFSTPGDFMNLDSQGKATGEQFQLIAYNNLVYLIRAVANVQALGAMGGLGVTSGLLIDTYVPTSAGNLARAQGARYKQERPAVFRHDLHADDDGR